MNSVTVSVTEMSLPFWMNPNPYVAPSSNCRPYLAHTLQLTLHDVEAAVVFMTSEVVYVYVCEFISICQLSSRDRNRRRRREIEGEGEATCINHKLKCCAINSSCSIGKTAKATSVGKGGQNRKREKEKGKDNDNTCRTCRTGRQTGLGAVNLALKCCT